MIEGVPAGPWSTNDYGLSDMIDDVTDWHVAEFGPGEMRNPLRAKLREEAIELYAELSWSNPNTEHLAEEIADVFIVLCAIAGRNKIDLLDAARKKLEIVKARNQKQRDAERGIVHDNRP